MLDSELKEVIAFFYYGVEIEIVLVIVITISKESFLLGGSFDIGGDENGNDDSADYPGMA